MPQQLSRSKTVLLIAVLVVIWGASWPIYKTALSFTPPLLFAGMRTFLGGLILALFALPGWRKIEFRRHRRVYFISAFFNIFLFFGLQTVGLTFMPGGLFSVVVYFQPVLVGILAWVWLGESMTAGKVAGLVLGFVGVAAISANSFSAHLSAVGFVLALLTAVSWAFGSLFIKRSAGACDPIWLVAIQSMLGGAVLWAGGLATESWSDIVWNAPYLSGLAFGSLLGVPTAWVIFFLLVRSGEVSKVSACTFLVPLIAVSSSTVFLHEPFSMLLMVGLVCISVSIYAVNRPARPGVGGDKRRSARDSKEGRLRVDS
ncbi:MAG: rane protein [Paenibacillaceae bacterium]|jgi:drug/metabolite transporter (DMT)-like permease|nr:rane protein [Paenibacillaceae bacterium]